VAKQSNGWIGMMAAESYVGWIAIMARWWRGQQRDHRCHVEAGRGLRWTPAGRNRCDDGEFLRTRERARAGENVHILVREASAGNLGQRPRGTGFIRQSRIETVQM
jgi:hypothetical protein